MDSELLREISEQYLLPFFSGAKLEPGTIKSTTRADRAAHAGPLAIKFKVNLQDRYRLVLSRPQPFTFSGSRVVTEIDVVRAFCDVLAMMETQLTGPLKADLLSTFQRRIVARAIRNAESEARILQGIDQLVNWGTRLYEGAPISASIGYVHSPEKHTPSFQDFSDCEFSAVLSNGYDTILSFDYDGGFIGHESLPRSQDFLPFSPMRQNFIAAWTGNQSNRIALTLNRLGEILVFRKQELVFARRSGRWHYLTHEPVISQMNVPRDRALRRSIYETCLDASFARTGACIGVVSMDSWNKWKSIVGESDHLAASQQTKARALRKVVQQTHFSNLDRRVRQELVATDGATLIAHTGRILAIGAILKVQGGSEGGGRLAAAKALSSFGLGVKVSQDGAISGFRRNKTAPAFRIM